MGQTMRDVQARGTAPSGDGGHAATATRRGFLAGAAAAGAAAAATAVFPPYRSASAAAAEAGGAASVIEELPVPEAAAPETTRYSCDILVVGSGFAGSPAAIEAAQAGMDVVLVDKGYPGYSGCSPFPQCYQYFNEETGDSRAAQMRATQEAGEYIANLDWYDVYLNESKECFDQLVEWGIYDPFAKASEAGDYFDEKRYQDYHADFAEHDRRARWHQLLVDNGITLVDHTMVTDVIEQDGRVVGAMGLHVPSGTVVTFNAKAVILCVGGGAYKNGGWPLSGDTFDGEWMAYQLGLPIVGKEFSYNIATSSVAPSCAWRAYTWGYLENLHAVGATYNDDNVDDYIVGRATNFILKKQANMTEGVAPIGPDETSVQPLSNPVSSTDPDDPRMIGNNVDPMPKRNVEGAAVGKGTHKCEGIWCGVDDLVGYTGLPGLYAAGDSLASMIYGALYTPGQGGSIVISHIQGRRAAKAAVEYASGAQAGAVPDDVVAEKSAQILAPAALERGFNPYWAQDILYNAMAPYWVDFMKSEETLTTALSTVLYLRDHVADKLIATNAHELRVCHEMKHKILSAEIKLRESLERKESRGYCQRTDYPYRDDENFLCYIAARKGEDGQMTLERVPVKDEWKGDLSKPYTERYPARWPGEAEALGLEEETAEEPAGR